MRLFTKTQICLSCFGSTNLGHPASFKSLDGLVNLDVWLWFAFPPFILSFHRPCAPRRPRWSLSHYFGRDPPHSMHLANEFGLTALASVSYLCVADWRALRPGPYPSSNEQKKMGVLSPLRATHTVVKILGRTYLWRTVSDQISGAENCTVTRRSSAYWQVMSEGSKHVCSINCCIRSWLEIFPPVRSDDTDLYLDWFVKLSKFLGV